MSEDLIFIKNQQIWQSSADLFFTSRCQQHSPFLSICIAFYVDQFPSAGFVFVSGCQKILFCRRLLFRLSAKWQWRPQIQFSTPQPDIKRGWFLPPASTYLSFIHDSARTGIAGPSLKNVSASPVIPTFEKILRMQHSVCLCVLLQIRQ